MIELITAVQLNCLAEAVFAEARGEPYAEQVYVAGVVKNRVLDDRFEDDFCKVINEPWQFSFVHEVSRFQLKRSITKEEEAWERAQSIAYSVANSGPEPLFGNALYFHADYVKPDWDYSKLVRLRRVGSSYFYTDKG